MSYSILWTLLPNGINPANGRARLSLVASPRLLAVMTKFGGSPLARWPEVVAAFGPLAVAQPDGSREAASVVSAAPEPALWARLVADSLPVDPYTKTDAPVFSALETSYAHASAVSAVDRVYADAMRNAPTEPLTRNHPVAQTVAGLHRLAVGKGDGSSLITTDIASLIDPAVLDSKLLAQAAQRLQAAGDAAAAEMLPLALMRQRRRRSDSRGVRGAAVSSKTAVAQPTGIAAKLRAADQPDFHQVVGALLEHPALAVRVGLRIDLEIPAFRGERLLRVVGAGGAPLDGQVAVVQPWSAVVCDPQRQLFVMQTQPDAPADACEVVRGQVDLSPPTSGQPSYSVTDIDVNGAQEQLSLMAAKLGGKGETPATLPPLRNGGLTVARRDRRSTTIAHALARSARFDGPAAEVAGAPVLYADDVTVGYRVDVSDNDGPFRSLMRRITTYRFDDGTRNGFAVTDEGTLDGSAAVEQMDNQGVPRLSIGEELFSWSGRSLAAHHPGPVASGDGQAARAEVVTPQPLPGTTLIVSTVPEPGTLPRLRFGHRYRFRVRTVDLAGNSIEPELCEPSFASTPTVYRRLDPVPAPIAVARRAYRPGESHARIVVRSLDGNTPVGAACERHIAPPAGPQHLGELHGTFDAAFGPDSPARAAARQQLLAVGKRQDGAWTDPAVPLDDGTLAQQPGIAVIKSDPGDMTPIPMLPLPRGVSLPAGQYVVHDTDGVRLPYLPDPATDGVAFHGLPPSDPTAPKAPIVLKYGTGAWPDAQPVRLVVQAGQIAASRVVRAADGRPSLVIDVPPAAQLTVQFSSALTDAAVAAMDPAALLPGDAARQGAVPMLARRDSVVLVHAVQQPLVAPTLALSSQTIQRPPSGGTWIGADCEVGAHLPSTSRVDIESSWTDITDTGTGPVTTELHRAVVGSVVLDSDLAQRTLSVHQTFDDTKHRSLSFTAIGTTRFTDCFEPPEPGQAHTLQRAGASVIVEATSTRRPPPPQVHSTLPILRWVRSMNNGQYRSRRICAGVRVWLKRPWHVTGAGETLGVVLHASKASYDRLKASPDHDLFTRWGADMYEGVPMQVGNHPPLLVGEVVNRVGAQSGVNLPGTHSGSSAADFALAEVAVAFDAERDLWYADIELDSVSGLTGLNAASWPFLRFGLVRFQKHTAPFKAGEMPPHASAMVTTDFVQLLPQRHLTATLLAPDRVHVSLGSFASNESNTHQYQARWQQRRFGGGISPDICIDAPFGGGMTVLQKQSGDFSRMSGEVVASASGGSQQAWQEGRIVVDERQVGWSVESPSDAHRVVYREVFDVSVFTRPDGPL